MNNVEKLSKLFGNAAALSLCCNVSRTLVTRWKKAGIVPPSYNRKILEGAANTAALIESEEKARDFINQVQACLEPSVCPCCGKELDDHRVI